MVFNIWTILLWLLALQGLALGVVILRKATRNPKSNHLIASLLFIFFLACVGLILKEWKHESADWIQLFPFYHLILVGPIIHLFLRSELESGYQPSWQDRTHFIVGLWSFRALLLPFGNWREETSGSVNNWLTYIYDYGDVFVWLVITSYLVLGLITYNNYKSSPRSVWIKQFLDLFVFFQFAIWLPIIALHISPYQFVFEELGVPYESVYVPFALIIYWVGIKWFFDSPTLTFKSVTKRFIERRLSSSVTSDCIEDLYSKVKTYELYRHSDVSILDLTKVFAVSEETITYLLHQELGMTFTDFITSVRVDQLLKESVKDTFNDLNFKELAKRNGFESTDHGATALESYTALSKSEIEALVGRSASSAQSS